MQNYNKKMTNHVFFRQVRCFFLILQNEKQIKNN